LPDILPTIFLALAKQTVAYKVARLLPADKQTGQKAHPPVFFKCASFYLAKNKAASDAV
jgi:hypothetical protein